jgi:hypothetical protein
LARLRKEVHVVNEVNVEVTDSLLNKLNNPN